MNSSQQHPTGQPEQRSTARGRGTGVKRHSKDSPCPICNGSPDDPRGVGHRCTGFIASDPRYVYCSREERAGLLPVETSTSPVTYKHYLGGPCKCGMTHQGAIFHAVEPKAGKAKTRETKSKGRLVESYIYEDANGNPWSKVDRYDPKSFPQWHKDGIDNRGRTIWKSGMRGIERIPYKLPDIIRSLSRDEVIYIVEGEKDANRLATYGFIATTLPEGAKEYVAGRPYKPNPYISTLIPYLKDRHVVIIPDNDDTGRAHAEALAKALHGVAKSVRILDLTAFSSVEIPPKGDVSDYFDRGGTADDLVDMAGETFRWKPTATAGLPDLRIAKVEDESSGGLRVAEFDKPPLTDMGNGERMVRLFGGRFRYVHPWSKWLVWDDRRWNTDNTAAIARLVKRTVRSIYGEAKQADDDQQRKALAKWAEESEAKKLREAMLWSAAREEGIPALPSDLDRDPWLFNCRNGTIDLRTGRLRAHDPKDMLTKMAPVDFDPDATCSLWLETLGVFLQSDELVGFWQRLCGYTLTGVIREQILPIAYGEGANGKSTILGTMLALLGPDYAMKASPEFLMQRKTDSHPTERASLFGKRLVVAIETDEGQRINETLIKELTGNDRISARRMREDPWEFDPTHKIFIGTNHKPTVKGTDHAIWRRLKLIPFMYTMDSACARLDIPELLKTEFPGILAWCVRGCLEWQRNGLQEPAEVAEATQQYREEEDIILGFITEHCTIHPNAKIKSTPLYECYRKWTESVGLMPLSQRKFTPMILKRDKGIKRVENNGFWFYGLGLRAEDDWGHPPEDSPRTQPSQPSQPKLLLNDDSPRRERSTGNSVAKVEKVAYMAPEVGDL